MTDARLLDAIRAIVRAELETATRCLVREGGKR